MKTATTSITANPLNSTGMLMRANKVEEFFHLLFRGAVDALIRDLRFPVQEKLVLLSQARETPRFQGVGLAHRSPSRHQGPPKHEQGRHNSLQSTGYPNILQSRVPERCPRRRDQTTVTSTTWTPCQP